MKKLLLLLIAIALMGGLLWWSDLSMVVSSLQVIDVRILILSCLLQLITIFVINFQCQQLATTFHRRVALGKILHVNLVGSFVESVTPAVKAGGELVKIGLFRSHLGFSTVESTVLVGMQKVINLVTFVFLNSIGLVWFLFIVEGAKPYTSLLVTCFGILIVSITIILILLFYPIRAQQLLEYLPLPLRFRQKVEEGVQGVRVYTIRMVRHKRVLVVSFALSLFMWIFYVLKSYLLAKALQIEIGFVAMAVITYLSYMVAMVPLSPGGLGTFEGTMVFLLAFMGIGMNEGMALSLVIRFVTFWFVFFLSALYLGFAALWDLRSWLMNRNWSLLLGIRGRS